MIDLHCHMLPGIDDGAKTLADALAMARIAVTDGITVTACTPHIYPGMYENTTAGIREAVAALASELATAGIPLSLTVGTDAHLTPELFGRLSAGTAPTLGGTRYFLLEPPHHVEPPRFDQQIDRFLAAGYVPLITHPERLTWIDGRYEKFIRAARRGAWLQVTSGSLTGDFGSDARYWGEKLVDEGWVHILATDAHGVNSRRPELAKGRAAAARLVGDDEAGRMVVARPAAVLANARPDEVQAPPALSGDRRSARRWWKRLTADIFAEQEAQ
jgi:protein-tyrosine phosphatase